MKKCTAVIARNKDKYLMLFHKKMNALTPPGGKVDGDETPIQCAIRELKEEVNIEATENDLVLCNTLLTSIPNYGSYLLYVYILKRDQDVAENVEYDKHSLLGWYSVNDIRQFKRVSYSANCILNGHKAFDEFLETYENDVVPEFTGDFSV